MASMIYPDNYSPPQPMPRERSTVLVTCRGILIGGALQDSMPAPDRYDEEVQTLMLHRRPLEIDQLYVRMMCGEQ